MVFSVHGYSMCVCDVLYHFTQAIICLLTTQPFHQDFLSEELLNQVRSNLNVQSTIVHSCCMGWTTISKVAVYLKEVLYLCSQYFYVYMFHKHQDG